MGLGDKNRRPRSSGAVKPLQFIAAGHKLRDLPPSQSEASAQFQKLTRPAEGWNSFNAFLYKVGDESGERNAAQDWLAIDDLCQRFELRKLVEGAAERLQGNCQGMLPRAAERLSAARRLPQRTDVRLALSGQMVGGPGRRNLIQSNHDNWAWPSEDFSGCASPDVEQEPQERASASKRSRPHSRGSPAPQSNGPSPSKRLTYIGRGPSLPSMGPSEGPVVEELAARLGGLNVDIPRLAGWAVDNKRSPSTPAKRSLVGGPERDGKVAVASSSARDQETHLLSPDSLGFWATQQSPSLADDCAAELPIETNFAPGIVRDASTPASPLNTQIASSPCVVKGRAGPPLNRSQSTPLPAAEASVNYMDFCHKVGPGTAMPVVSTAEDSDCADAKARNRLLIDAPEAKELLLDSAVTTPTLGSGPESVSSSAVGSRPGTTGSSRPSSRASGRSNANRRGMPLSSQTRPLAGAAGGSAHSDNLFGLVSRSRNFSQGSPTELGPALASTPAHMQATRSKPAAIAHRSVQ